MHSILIFHHAQQTDRTSTLRYWEVWKSLKILRKSVFTVREIKIWYSPLYNFSLKLYIPLYNFGKYAYKNIR
jgi:hypothetical protein